MSDSGKLADLDAIEAEIEAEIGRAGKQGPVPKALFDARALTAALRAAWEEIERLKTELGVVPRAIETAYARGQFHKERQP